jgi:two-component system, NtrC family, C4-dicarboxylate transport sensor histidine kinase DctB
MQALRRFIPNVALASGRARLMAIALALAAGVVGASWLSAELAASRAFADLEAQAKADAVLNAAMLQSELEQIRDSPTFLSEDPEVRAAVNAPIKSARAQRLNEKLHLLSERTRARVIYLIGPDGITRAASNFATTTSFVGQNYRFRAYFREAMARGESTFFALGTVSAAPGLYIARRVQNADGVAGVVVVKIEFKEIEAQWSRLPARIVVVDASGIVILTNVANWRYRATAPLSKSERDTIRESLQFGENPNLAPLPLAAHTGRRGGAILTREVIEATGWTLIARTPVAAAVEASARTGGLIGALAALLIAGAIWVAILRARRVERDVRVQEQIRQDLELRVRARTSDLDQANARLTAEITERQRAEGAAQLLQDELIQANRLAVLGQISAGVAHEINQPLSAIRTFAANANLFLDRADAASARNNMQSIADLADRIAAITDELRQMSRKSTAPRARVSVIDAIEGAMLLVGARARMLGARIDISAPDRTLGVFAHKTRLEQVLLNLLQNALDAVAERPAPRISLTCERMGQEVWIGVADNGPGLAPEAEAGLFTPFTTTKPQGLGLGLVISQDICREYGGHIVVWRPPLGGAGFRIILPEVT